jgi:hypothetical protein
MFLKQPENQQDTLYPLSNHMLLCAKDQYQVRHDTRRQHKIIPTYFQHPDPLNENQANCYFVH